MWEATINSTSIDDKGLTVLVDFTDGTTTLTKQYTTPSQPSDSWISDQVQATLQDLNYFSVFTDAIKKGDSVGDPNAAVTTATPGDIVTTTPPISPPVV